MKVLELERWVRQLRLGGMVAVLETRLCQAQAQSMTPSVDRLLGLREAHPTPAQTRYSNAAANRPPSVIPAGISVMFDLTCSPKINRSLVFRPWHCYIHRQVGRCIVSRSRPHLSSSDWSSRHSVGLSSAVSRKFTSSMNSRMPFLMALVATVFVADSR